MYRGICFGPAFQEVRRRKLNYKFHETVVLVGPGS